LSIVLINVRWTYFISETDVSRAKNFATLFSSSHHNQMGLFVEPDIDSNYRAIDSTNFTEIFSLIIYLKNRITTDLIPILQG